VLSPNSSGGSAGLPPLVAFDRISNALVATLLPGEWVYGFPRSMAVDQSRNLLYLVASSANTNRVIVLDGTRLQGDTQLHDALVGDPVVVGLEDGSELAMAVAVDAARNLIYVTRCALSGCEQPRNALVVLRGAEIDLDTRALLHAPEKVTEIPEIGVQYGGGRREIVLDPDRTLIYVAGAFGSVGHGEGFGSTDITVLDGLKIVDAQGQVSPSPAEAVLGVIPIKVLPGPDGEPLIPIVGDFSSREMAFNAEQGFLYVVTKSSIPFEEGFVSVINSALVIDAQRSFNRTERTDAPGALSSLIATIPVGLDPTFVAVDPDPGRNRVMVTNQAPGALTVLQGLSGQ